MPKFYWTLTYQLLPLPAILAVVAAILAIIPSSNKNINWLTLGLAFHPILFASALYRPLPQDEEPYMFFCHLPLIPAAALTTGCIFVQAIVIKKNWPNQWSLPQIALKTALLAAFYLTAHLAFSQVLR